MVLLEEDHGGANALRLDWLDEKISLVDVKLVNDALEGGDRDAVPAWIIVAPAWVVMGVALFPVSPVLVSIASGLFALVVASRLFAVVVLLCGGKGVCLLLEDLLFLHLWFSFFGSLQSQFSVPFCSVPCLCLRVVHQLLVCWWSAWCLKFRFLSSSWLVLSYSAFGLSRVVFISC